jgi:hypothetical protein
MRQDLKVHQFTLSNLIKDVSLLASSTKSNLKRSIRKLNLRAKYEQDDGKVLTAVMDTKIWKYEIKSQIADLTKSQEGANTIIK